MAKPWRKLFRKLVENPMYFSEPFDKTHAWIDLILLAEDDGVVRTTVPTLAYRWKWSEGKVRRFLKAFADDGAIEYAGKGGRNKNGRENGRENGRVSGMFVSLVNWDIYQGERKENGRVSGRENGRENGRVSSRGVDNIDNNSNILKERGEEIENPHNPPKHDDLESEFSQVWEQYPRKQGRQNALRDYIKAREDGIEFDTIMNGVSAYNFYLRKSHTGQKYIKMGSTWFHQRCWEDDYLVADGEESDRKTLSKRQQAVMDMTDSLNMMKDWAERNE